MRAIDKQGRGGNTLHVNVAGSFRQGLLGMSALLALIGSPAMAQQRAVPINESPTVDRGRLDRQDAEVPRAGAPARLPSAPTYVAPSGAVQVLLSQVRYEGASLDPQILDQAVKPFLGLPLEQANLQKVADAISAAYAKSDIAFYAVSIPAQTGAGGVLIVRLLEGRVVKYALASETGSTPKRLIAAHVRSLMNEVPTRKSTVERTLSLLRDIPGQTVQAQLRQTEVPGELALDLDVKRKQVEISVNVNNRGVYNVTTGAQSQVSVALNGGLREGDVTRLSAYVPIQPNRYQFYSASHQTPIGANGTTIGLSGAYVRTQTRGLNIVGTAKQGGIVVMHPLIRSYEKNMTITASFDGTNSDNYYLDTAFGGFRTRAVRLGANWSSVGKTGGYGVSVSLSHGVEGLGAREMEGYSKASFRKGNIQANVVKQIGARMSARVSARAQYSPDNLPTTERFVLGGDGAGLAFRDGFLTADKAVAGSFEVGIKAVGVQSDPRGVSVFAYTDGALANSRARPFYGLTKSDYSLASAGGGVRITPVKQWAATAQIAVPVKSPFSRMSKKARFFFSVSRTM